MPEKSIMNLWHGTRLEGRMNNHLRYAVGHPFVGLMLYDFVSDTCRSILQRVCHMLHAQMHSLCYILYLHLHHRSASIFFTWRQ
jgi:hypothetical protein